MSDNEYEDYGEYEEYENNDYGGDENMDQPAEQQDYETKVQLDYFQAEDMYRKNQLPKCIDSLQELYSLSVTHNLKSWKVKILNFLLQIYCQSLQEHKIHETLERILQLNQTQKYTQNAIKSIIRTLKSLPKQMFDSNKEIVEKFIQQLDNEGKVKSYILLIEKANDENNIQQADKIIRRVKQLLAETPSIPASTLIQIFSYEVLNSKKTGKDISSELKKIHLKLSSLESEGYLSEGHMSIIKEAIAQNLYLQQNYKECAIYLCQTFKDNMKYGKDPEHKKILLKANVLVSLLINNKEEFTTQKFNALYNESAAGFKLENDIQCLYGVLQAFIDIDLNMFQEHSKTAQFNFPKPYENLFERVQERLKMTRLLQLIKSYKTIKLSYLQRRLNSTYEQVERMLINLITDDNIQGRLRREQKETYLDISPEEDKFLTVQLENIKQISKKYI